MIGWVKNLVKKFVETQNELADAGMFYIATSYGFYSYFDQEQYKAYLAKKEKDNESN